MGIPGVMCFHTVTGMSLINENVRSNLVRIAEANGIDIIGAYDGSDRSMRLFQFVKSAGAHAVVVTSLDDVSCNPGRLLSFLKSCQDDGIYVVGPPGTIEHQLHRYGFMKELLQRANRNGQIIPWRFCEKEETGPAMNIPDRSMMSALVFCKNLECPDMRDRFLAVFEKAAQDNNIRVAESCWDVSDMIRHVRYGYIDVVMVPDTETLETSAMTLFEIMREFQDSRVKVTALDGTLEHTLMHSGIAQRLMDRQTPFLTYVPWLTLPSNYAMPTI